MKISNKKGKGYSIADVSLIRTNCGSLFDNKYQNLKCVNPLIKYSLLHPKDIMGCKAKVFIQKYASPYYLICLEFRNSLMYNYMRSTILIHTKNIMEQIKMML